MWTKEHLVTTLNYYLDKYVLIYLFTEKQYVKWKFKRLVGYSLNLEKPLTFCEKMQWLKFNLIRDDFSMMVDKIDAKIYVENIIGSEYIIPTLKIFDNVEEINWDKLPNQFVIKLANDSGGVVICKDKKLLNVDDAINKLLANSGGNYSKYTKEYPYKNIKSRIIVEKLIVDGVDAELKDYKFYCFNGHAEYCQVIADRSNNKTIDFYDREWIHQPFIGLAAKARNASKIHQEPVNYKTMLEIADLLANKINHPFVRIDLYNANGCVYFGEITFFPNSGMGRIIPYKWDLLLGEKIKLPIIK